MQVLPAAKMTQISRISNRVAHGSAQLGKRECGVSHELLPSLILDCNNVVA